MPSSPEAQTYGPGNGSLRVLTYGEGVASKAGHDLVLEVGRWEATVLAGQGRVPSALALSADPRSLKVSEAHHGVKPLTDADRAKIANNIDRKVLGGAPIGFRSTGVEAAAGDMIAIEGELELASATRRLRFTLELDDRGHLRGTIPLTPSEWGIKPYSALMGALRVRDAVDVVVEAELAPG